MPNVYHYSIDRLHEVLDEMISCGIFSCILFGIPAHKDETGSQAYASDGIVQRAIRFIKAYDERFYVIGDVCMCEYTSHGHCGILDEHHDVDNDATLPVLSKSQSAMQLAGIDMVAPSDMMDGHIKALREALDEAGFTNVAIMGYSAKFASSYYGPFREAADSAPCLAIAKAIRWIIITAERHEGGAYRYRRRRGHYYDQAAMSYLDMVSEVHKATNVPIAAYSVSGEYAW